MNYNAFTTDEFERRLKKLSKKYRSLKFDYLKLVESLKKNPIQGDTLGKDCYKVRLAITSKGKGKSGGARVVFCVKIIEGNIYLLTIFDKSEKDNITDTELDILLKEAGLK